MFYTLNIQSLNSKPIKYVNFSVYIDEILLVWSVDI